MAVDNGINIEHYVGHVGGPIMPSAFSEAARANRESVPYRRRDVVRGFSLRNQTGPIRIGDKIIAAFPTPVHKPEAFNHTTSDTEVNLTIVGIADEHTDTGVIRRLVAQEVGNKRVHLIDEQAESVEGFILREVVKPSAEVSSNSPAVSRHELNMIGEYKRIQESMFQLAVDRVQAVKEKEAARTRIIRKKRTRKDVITGLETTAQVRVIDSNRERGVLDVIEVDTENEIVYFERTGNRFGVPLEMVQKTGIISEPGRGHMRITGLIPRMPDPNELGADVFLSPVKAEERNTKAEKSFWFNKF